MSRAVHNARRDSYRNEMEAMVRERSKRRTGGKVTWLAAIAILALVASAGVAFAVAGPGETAGWPAAKAQAWQQGKAEMAAARAHPRPKPANPQAEAPPHRPDPTPLAGIQNDMHEGPFSLTEFRVLNFWQGPVGADWILVYAGARRGPVGSTAQQGAIRLYSEPRDVNGDVQLIEIGTYLAPSAVSTLTITAVKGTVMELHSDGGAVLSFDLRTHQFR